jgi:hypothetical protein
MSLVHVAGVPIPPYDLRTQGTLHFFLPDLHKAGLGTKLLVERLLLRVHVTLRGEIAERIVSTVGGAEEQVCCRKQSVFEENCATMAKHTWRTLAEGNSTDPNRFL